MKDLYLQPRNRKKKKDTSNGKRNGSMLNLQEKQKKSEMRKNWGRLGKVIWRKNSGLIFAAQVQALRTNWVRKNIHDQEVLRKYRMRGERDESITHLIAKCKNDNVARIVHLGLCQMFGLVDEVKWYNYKPASAVENGRVKILWDFNIKKDDVSQHRRLGIVVL